MSTAFDSAEVERIEKQMEMKPAKRGEICPRSLPLEDEGLGSEEY